MTGLERLSNEERQEMIQDAQDPLRGKTFLALKIRAHSGTLDEYIDFLSENMGSFSFPHSPKISKHFKL